MAKLGLFKSTRSQFWLMVIVFALLGGGYFVYKSFAASSAETYVRVLNYTNTKSSNIIGPQDRLIPCVVGLGGPDYCITPPPPDQLADPSIAEDSVPNIGLAKVNEVTPAKPLLYMGGSNKASAFLSNCYILRNPGVSEVTVQLTSGAALLNKKLQPSSDYQRICVDYKGTKTTKVYGFNVRILGSSPLPKIIVCDSTESPVIIPCPDPGLKSPKVYVYADEQVYKIDGYGVVGFSGTITGSTCPPDVPNLPASGRCLVTAAGGGISYSVQILPGQSNRVQQGKVMGYDGKTALKGKKISVYGEVESADNIVTVTDNSKYFVEIK